MLRSAWLRGAALDAQAFLPSLREAALEARVSVSKIDPWLRGTALKTRVPVAVIGPGLKGTALEARVLVAVLGALMYQGG